MRKQQQNIINCLLKFKSVANSDFFVGSTIINKFKNMHYYFTLINKVIYAHIINNKENLKTNLLILCTYDYLLSKRKKESCNYLSELQTLKNIYFNED